MHNAAIMRVMMLISLLSIGARAEEPADPVKNAFYHQVMVAPPLMPANLSDHFVSCPVNPHPKGWQQYRTADEVKYQQQGWEKRVSSNWQYFHVPLNMGRIVVIDYAAKGKTLGYRYLANHDSEHQLYEPWSSSKLLVLSAAIAKARQQGVSGNAMVGSNMPLADLITSIHSYEPFGQADGNSNAIATYLLNVVGRGPMTALLHDQWLKLANPAVRIRGGYANKVYKPDNDRWQDRQTGKSIVMKAYASSSDDPDYQAYRCKTCGLTGNKPLSALAEAEWLKRLASQQRVPETGLPGLSEDDLQVIFYGKGNSDDSHQVGGMMQGISRMLSIALANSVAGHSVADPKAVLDKVSQGRWRIWQKMGSGGSETRNQGEVVVLAHVCLPGFDGGREFTVAAQAATPNSHDDNSVSDAGSKMQQLLNKSMQQLLYTH